MGFYASFLVQVSLGLLSLSSIVSFGEELSTFSPNESRDLEKELSFNDILKNLEPSEQETKKSKLESNLTEKKLVAVRQSSYVTCYYFDPKYPHLTLNSDIPWAWAKYEDDSYVRIHGNVDGGFFTVDTEIRFSELRRICKNSIPEGQELLNFKTTKGKYSREYEILFPLDVPKNLSFSKIVVFGDSISDSGNLHSWARIPNAPYWNGRYSDGPVWVEYLSAFLSHIPVLNWSYAGAKTSGRLYAPDWISLAKSWVRNSFTGSVEGYVTKYLANDNPSFEGLKDTLFIVWAGGNNYVEKGEGSQCLEENIAEGPKQLQCSDRGVLEKDIYLKTPSLAIEDLHRTLSALCDRGAKYIFIPPVPRVHATPWAKLANIVSITDRAVNEQIKLMDDLIDGLEDKYPDTKFIYPDLGEAEHSLAKEYDLDNEDICLDLDNYKKPCDDPKAKLYYDDIHPSSFVHCLIAYLGMEHFAQEGLVKDESNFSKMHRHCLNLSTPHHSPIFFDLD